MSAKPFTLVRYLSTVLDSIKEGAVLIDVEADGGFRLALANRAFHHISGYGPDCVGKEVSEFVLSERHEFVRKQFNKVLAHNQPIGYTRWSTVPAGRRALEVDMIPMQNRFGAVVHIIVLIRDITKFAQLKEEVQSLRAATYATDTQTEKSENDE